MSEQGDDWSRGDSGNWGNQHLHEKFKPLLRHLKDGSKVAVITMTGSCCPITKAHTMAFEVARNLIVAKEPDEFAQVLGTLSLNSDNHVWQKLEEKGEEMIDWFNRAMLADLATADISWMGVSYLRESWVLHDFQNQNDLHWSRLQFIQYHMNGADDVLKYEKWNWAVEDERYITVGRPGYTEKLQSLAKETKLFLIGPELPEISSSQVRTALFEQDNETLQRFLHPAVASWCLSHSPYGCKRQKN